MRASTFALLGALLVCSAAEAGTVRASTGARAEVANSATANFQCLVTGLEKTGYRIDFMGGWRKHGSVRHSLHPAGLALDINQTARGRVTRPFPANVDAIASRCGVFHGSVWKNQDQGHFQIGASGGRSVKRKWARLPAATPFPSPFSLPWFSR